MTAWGKFRSKNKMGNTNSTCALGHSHRSKLESSVCQMIQLREKAGELVLEQVEDHVYLTRSRICYIPDFRCRVVATGEPLFVEAKGFPNDRWPMIKKLWKDYGPAPLEIWKGTYQRPYLDEVVIPVVHIHAECPVTNALPPPSVSDPSLRPSESEAIPKAKPKRKRATALKVEGTSNDAGA